VFNLQGSEIINILLLALVVLGPEKLPDAMRKAGQFYAELKKMSTGFQSEFRAAIDEPLKELKETANTIRDSADFTKLQSGERPEKPKSAEMVVPADPDAVPTENLPFQPESTDFPEQNERAPLSEMIAPGGAASTATTPSGAVVDENTKPEPFSGAQEPDDAFGQLPRAAADPRPVDAEQADPHGDVEEPTS
jgi:sec-independent protein translocase protein TatB